MDIQYIYIYICIYICIYILYTYIYIIYIYIYILYTYIHSIKLVWNPAVVGWPWFSNGFSTWKCRERPSEMRLVIINYVHSFKLCHFNHTQMDAKAVGHTRETANKQRWRDLKRLEETTHTPALSLKWFNCLDRLVWNSGFGGPWDTAKLMWFWWVSKTSKLRMACQWWWLSNWNINQPFWSWS